MRLLDRARDRNELRVAQDRRREILRVGVAGPVERLADRAPEPCRRQAGCERVDRHDPPGMKDLGFVTGD
jgi:hypothetical protein